MVSLSISGDRAVLFNLKATELRARGAVRGSIVRSTLKVQRLAKEKVSGPVLKNRTGTLRRKINQRVAETDRTTTGTVGLKLAYGAAHEFGFDGIVTVKAHLRHVTQAFGKPIAPVDVAVRAHPMHVHLPERSFLRSALADLRGEIVGDLDAALAAALR